ncbi:hypothetical protein HWV62_30573 [Athelia sp. TMB]|nr:hypothetical protein HWV62_30573 [Athelia sp. TMB]
MHRAARKAAQVISANAAPHLNAIRTAAQLLSSLTAHWAYTFFLMCKPSSSPSHLRSQAVFACVAAPVASPAHLLHGLAWIALHQLQCNVSNQASTGAEDAINRPWRPLPAKRITPRQMAALRWALPPLCVALSAAYGWDVAAASVGLTATTVVYDEWSLAGHWIGKNACNIAGYVTFELGASKIMGETSTLDATAVHAICCSAFIIFTTIQSQDFSDVEGDASIGRVTFPIYAPEGSRLATLVAMCAWSVYMAVMFELGPLAGAAFCALGAYVGLRYYTLRGVEQDKASYRVYNLWLFAVHLLPAQTRWGALNF